MATSGLREVTRRAVRRRIAEVAEALFVEKGFEATTVCEIAEAVGMSQRSFFRYFASKEDVVIDNYERLGDAMVERLAGCAADETEWALLRRAFDAVVVQHTDGELRARGAVIQQVVESSPALLSAYLEKLERIQDRLVATLRARRVDHAGCAGCDVALGEDALDDVVLRAVVGSALACLQAVMSQAARAPDSFDLGGRLDVVMAELRPVCCG